MTSWKRDNKSKLKFICKGTIDLDLLTGFYPYAYHFLLSPGHIISFSRNTRCWRSKYLCTNSSEQNTVSIHASRATILPLKKPSVPLILMPLILPQILSTNVTLHTLHRSPRVGSRLVVETFLVSRARNDSTTGLEPTPGGLWYTVFCKLIKYSSFVF